MLPVVTEFVRKYSLDDFIVVDDSGLMNGDNIADLEANGYKYIIDAKIKNESRKIQEWILEQPKVDCQMVEYDKGNAQRLLVGYTDDRARKDAYNREKGIRRLEKAYSSRFGIGHIIKEYPYALIRVAYSDFTTVKVNSLPPENP